MSNLLNGPTFMRRGEVGQGYALAQTRAFTGIAALMTGLPLARHCFAKGSAARFGTIGARLTRRHSRHIVMPFIPRNTHNTKVPRRSACTSDVSGRLSLTCFARIASQRGNYQ
jgi:hypothetical protein